MTNSTITVGHYMNTRCVVLNPDMDILAASQILVKKQVSGAPVVQGTALVGILTERDCFKITLDAGYFGEFGGKVSEYMSTDLVTVTRDMSILDLAERFIEKKFRRYPVMEKDQLLGMIDRRDVLRALLDLA